MSPRVSFPPLWPCTTPPGHIITSVAFVSWHQVSHSGFWDRCCYLVVVEQASVCCGMSGPCSLDQHLDKLDFDKHLQPPSPPPGHIIPSVAFVSWHQVSYSGFWDRCCYLVVEQASVCCGMSSHLLTSIWTLTNWILTSTLARYSTKSLSIQLI